MKSPAGRADFIDEMRGFALLGIVLVNAPFLAISTVGYTPASVASVWDQTVAFGVVAFAQAKFYLLFSFLFGYSVTYLLPRDEPALRWRYAKRLLGLAVLGAAHATLAFVYDILLLYALLGAWMLLAVRWSDRALVRAATVALAFWLLLLSLLAWAGFAFESSAPEVEFEQAFDAALATGSFGEAVTARLHFWPGAFAVIATLNGLAVLAMFLLGLVAGRRRVLAAPEHHRVLWRRGLVWGLGLGAPIGLVSAWLAVGPGADVGSGSGRELLGVALGFAGAPLLSFGYVALLASVHLRNRQALAMFRPAGRMSLTGYLGESILLSLVFCGYGGGLFGEVGAATAALAGLLVWAALDAFSHAWLRRFRQGPFEMLLGKFAR